MTMTMTMTDDALPLPLATELRARRESLGLCQAEVWELAGRAMRVYQWEERAAAPDLASLLDWARALDVSIVIRCGSARTVLDALEDLPDILRDLRGDRTIYNAARWSVAPGAVIAWETGRSIPRSLSLCRYLSGLGAYLEAAERAQEPR